MREIKFRAWDKLGDDEGVPCMRAWGHLLNIQYQYSEDSIFNDPMLILMQYTGLKDKNGKEIYEGDVVRVIPNEAGTPLARVCEVRISPRMGYTLFINNRICAFSYEVDTEVIGNIYENPELMGVEVE